MVLFTGNQVAITKGVLKEKTMTLKDVIADLIIIGLSMAFLWHFSNMWRYGRYLVGEPNLLIRGLETGLLLVILVFGIVRFISRFRNIGTGKTE